MATKLYKNTTTTEIVEVSSTEKRGRWVYITFRCINGGPIQELTEQKFNAAYAPTRLSPKAKAEAETEAAVLDQEIEEGRAEGLSGFAKFRALHAPVKVDGRRVQNNGDEIAQRLTSMTLDEVYELASELTRIEVSWFQTAYGHLNPGMQRMNLGNRIRGAYRNHAV